MELVKAYKTSDGAIHSKKSEAVTRELEIRIRGIIQSNKKTFHNTGNVEDISKIFSGNVNELVAAINQYKQGMSNLPKNERKSES
jgi:hypothetical protein